MAIRLSIGAGRGQLVRQLLGESCLLALFGGAGGVLVAQWTLNLIATLLPAEAVATIQLTIDPAVMVFAAALALGTGVLFGLFPALHSTRPDLISSLKGQSGQPSGARSAARFRTGARDGADRAIDGAAGVGRLVHAEPVQRQPRRPRAQRRQHRDLRDLAGAERLQAGAIAAAVRARRGRDRRAARRHRASPVRRCRCSPAATGATTSRSRDSRRGPTPTADRASTKSVPATSRRSAFR